LPRRIETLFIPGPAGRLEALLEDPEHAAPTAAALVCHPHPQHGGTMHNKVVYRLARGLRQTGAVVLRFNYRGVNLSEGAYDNGNGETDDARAARDYLTARYPSLPLTLAGFSFGSRIALRLGCETNPIRVIAVGFPRAYQSDPTCPTPRIFIHSTHDQYGPADAMQSWFAQQNEPKRLIWIEARDHFFAGALDAFEQAVIQL